MASENARFRYEVEIERPEPDFNKVQQEIEIDLQLVPGVTRVKLIAGVGVSIPRQGITGDW
jgi:hypothetical protein